MEKISIASVAHGKTIFSPFKNICENRLEYAGEKKDWIVWVCSPENSQLQDSKCIWKVW